MKELFKSLQKSALGIGLMNPKNPLNVGSVMRSAGCFQVDYVCYTGNRYARAAKFRTDTKNIQQDIPLIKVDSLIQDVPDNIRIVCVDLIEGAIPLPDFHHPDPALYIFGPEDGTISQTIIDEADSAVFIPTIGCLNLAATVNILLYDRMAKSARMIANDALIRQNRDTNNTVRVIRNP